MSDFFKIDKVKIPNKKATANDMAKVPVPMFSTEISLAPKTIAPKEAGIKREKEKLKASCGANPNIRAIKMVEPAREIPGSIAIA